MFDDSSCLKCTKKPKLRKDRDRKGSLVQPICKEMAGRDGGAKHARIFQIESVR